MLSLFGLLSFGAKHVYASCLCCPIDFYFNLQMLDNYLAILWYCIEHPHDPNNSWQIKNKASSQRVKFNVKTQN